MTVNVSTPLRVPRDVDWLSWSIVRPGEARHLRTGSLELERPGQLPVHFTALSTRDTNGEVMIEVVAKQGGEAGVVRARRKVTLNVAQTGTGTLELVLERP